MDNQVVFTTYHPWILFLYFLQVVLCTSLFFHSLFLIISLVGGVCFYQRLYQGNSLRTQMVLVLGVMVGVTLLNGLWNHQGVTILWYLGDNPVTKEALIYGMVNGLMFCNIFLWFACLSKVMTANKIHYLFGSVAPTFALIFSMVLGFIPKLKHHMEQIKEARYQFQKEELTLKSKIQEGMHVVSMTMTWALEHSIDTADSMKARGYGTKKRTFFSEYRFDMRDCFLTLFICAMFGMNSIFYFLGQCRMQFFPTIQQNSLSIWSVVVYGLLCFLPEILQRKENRVWKHITSNM